MILLLGLAAMGWLVYFLLTNYVFVVRKVSVELPTDSRFTQQQAASAAGIRLGTRMDRLDTEAFEKGLQASGWLELEKFEIDYPDHVNLIVRERKPAAMISDAGTLLVIDSDGVLIEQVSGDPGYPDCIYIQDVEIRRAQPGQQLQTNDPEKIESIVALLKGLESVPCHDLISRASMADARNIRLYSVNHVWVEMGAGERMAEKLYWAEAALTDMVARGEQLGTLYVSSGKHADYAPQQ